MDEPAPQSDRRRKSYLARTDSIKRTDGPPDTRGGTAPLPLGILGLGIAAISIAVAGTFILQLVYAWGGAGGITPGCAAELTTKTADGGEQLVRGALGVCNIVRSFLSPAETFILVASSLSGLAASILGWTFYRKMPSRRMRNQCISGAVLGIQAAAVAGVIFWFRSGDVFVFARNFLNFGYLSDTFSGFMHGARNTMQLAAVGEVGGITIGLILAVLVISQHRVVRAPARVYINFFRGTPLIWQLGFFQYVFLLGLGLKLGTFTIATIVFILNTGAYASEVFRAGVESIERGQMEAARSLGMSYGQAMRYAIVPQAVRRVIPPLMNEFVILIKDTALIVVLGLLAEQQDIFGFARENYSATGNATFFIGAAIAYLVVTLPLIRLVNYVENRLRSGLTGRVG